MSRYLPNRRNYLGLFDDLFDEDFLPSNHTNFMRTDIEENENEYVFNVEAPGVDKENIKVHVDDGYLVVNVSYKKNSEEGSKKNYLRKERVEGTYQRSFYVGDKIDESKISAEYVDGVLRILVPKQKEEEKQERKYITIK